MLITEEKIEIIFNEYKPNRNDNYHEKIVILFQKLINNIKEKFNKNQNIEEIKSEINRIVDAFIKYIKILINKDSLDKLFDDEKYLLNIIMNNKIIIESLLDKNVIGILLNIKSNRKNQIFYLIKSILKTTKDYNNSDLFYNIKNKDEIVIERPEIKDETKIELRNLLKEDKTSLLKDLFIYDSELLIILSKILCYQDIDFYVKFIINYYNTCGCDLNSKEKDEIIKYF